MDMTSTIGTFQLETLYNC